jgi:hypothetical protein
MDFWKLCLAWGCLGMFFGVPILLLTLHIWNLQTPSAFIQHIQEFKYIGEYLKTVTVIIVSLAGLHTAEFFKK